MIFFIKTLNVNEKKAYVMHNHLFNSGIIYILNSVMWHTKGIEFTKRDLDILDE